MSHLDDPKGFNGIHVFGEYVFLGKLDGEQRKVQQFLGMTLDFGTLGLSHRLAHTTRHRKGRVDGPAGKMFPSNECSTCTIMPRMLETATNPNISILAFAEVESISGEPGDFKVKVLKKPRYVNPMKCNACTDCFAVCPVGGIPMEFNLGRGASKAISFYSPFPPRKALIHPHKCNYLLNGKCGEQEQPPCVLACKPEAIAFSQKPEMMELQVGAVILATGADEVKTELLEKYGYGKLPNVLTALEYERLLSGLGPTAGVVKRPDGKEPQSVAWYVLDSAAPIGIMTAVTEALGTVEKNPQVAVCVLCEDINIARESYHDFYRQAREKNIRRHSPDSHFPERNLCLRQCFRTQRNR